MLLRLNILPLVIVVVASTAEAASENVSCKITGVVRCICPASLYVECENGLYSGQMMDDQKVTSITMKVKLKDGTENSIMVPSPSLDINTYYRNAHKASKEVSRISGISAEQISEISLSSFSASTNLQLYEDADARTKINNPLVKSGDDGFGQCRYVDVNAPNLIVKQEGLVRYITVNNECVKELSKTQEFQGSNYRGEANLCFGYISCPDALGPELTLCEGLTDARCPAAVDCRNQFLREVKKSGKRHADVNQDDKFLDKPILYKGACAGRLSIGRGVALAAGSSCTSQHLKEDKCFKISKITQIMPALSSMQEPANPTGGALRSGAAK